MMTDTVLKTDDTSSHGPSPHDCRRFLQAIDTEWKDSKATVPWKDFIENNGSRIIKRESNNTADLGEVFQGDST